MSLYIDISNIIFDKISHSYTISTVDLLNNLIMYLYHLYIRFVHCYDIKRLYFVLNVCIFLCILVRNPTAAEVRSTSGPRACVVLEYLQT